MHCLVYTSTANVLLSEEQLQRLLDHWRTNNSRWHVTGVLLYSEGQIMQVLEGDAERLHTLFATIAADLRHHTVTRLADGPVPSRAFADWSMQFRKVDTADFQHLVQHLKTAPAHASALAPLLEAFIAQQPWE